MVKKMKAANDRLLAPNSGVRVRMYRIGHGDCFLLAFPGKTADKPVYVLIDCGYKPGSPGKIEPPTEPKQVAESILAATGGFIDVAVITHEHQDHVNAITPAHFGDLKIGQTWFAWTEDPDDEVARSLRKKHKDELLQLLAIRNRMATESRPEVKEIDEFLGFELGLETGEDGTLASDQVFALAKDPGASVNKKAMKLFKDLAKRVEFFRPHNRIVTLPGTNDVRVYALGPSRTRDILDTDPKGDEEFHLAIGTRSQLAYFAESMSADTASSPFPPRYRVRQSEAMDDLTYGEFFKSHYGTDADTQAKDKGEARDNAAWRRIDDEWVHSALELYIKANNATNNTSLVLAFELGKGGKVLLFAADAQRSNWLSWADEGWNDGESTVSAKDLLARTVLYKVGHHGSHNATLHGGEDSAYPSLGWMGKGRYAREFTAMITAVRAWAEKQKGWDHPMPAIKEALLQKCSGRVLQTDTPVNAMSSNGDGNAGDWKAFLSRLNGTDLFFDYDISREEENA